MATIDKFEDLRAWKAARILVNLVYEITKKKDMNRDFGLQDQIRRAAGSSMHNIAEGFDSGSNPEFIRFLRYALRSASEIQSQLYTAMDQGYINKEEFQTIYDKANETKGYIHGLIGYLVKSKSSKKIKESREMYIANQSSISINQKEDI